MATVTLWGATYSDVPAITVPSGNSTATFYDAEDGDLLEYGSDAPTDLTGTSWLINEIPNDYSANVQAYVAINFSSNGESFETFYAQFYSVGDSMVQYDFTIVFLENMGWRDPAYRTISILGGDDVTNADIITWLQNNATQL